MTRHALRTLVKSGHADALEMLGFRSDVPVLASVTLQNTTVKIGEKLVFECRVECDETLPVLVDYRIVFARPDGRSGEKVFKLKQGQVTPEKPFVAGKNHLLKADATTFTWHAGPHRLILQVNGVDRADVAFDVV